MELIPRYNHASKIVFICLVFFIQSYESLSQLQMQIPPESAQYTGATRGYWFEAPADFTIVGLRVPTDASSASQSIAVVRFNGGAPPLFSSTTNNFTILALYQNISGNSIISVNLPISDGDYIGVLGSRGSNSINSYGTSNYSTNIGGYPVTLGRFGMQYDLQSTSPIALWRENSGSISRVELYYSNAALISQNSIVACNVDSTQLSPDSSWSSYAWSTGDTTQTTYVSNSGLYYLTVTDMSSNLWTDSVYVDISNPVAQASIIPTDCESTANGVITASGFGGHEPYQYVWSNGSTSASINTLETGLYSLTITDILGCQNDNLFILSALDTIPPSISTQNISVYLDAYGEVNITASQINNGSADNCGIDSFAINFSAFDCDDAGVNVVTLTAWDTTGNSSSAASNVTVLDTTPPSISTQNISVYLDAYGEVNITASQINNGSADNCGIDSFAINFNAFACSDTGLNVVTLTAWDVNGNSSSAAANVTVLDTIPPSISTQNISVYLNAYGEANITASQINNGSADNCGIDSFAINFNAFACSDTGLNVVTLTAFDASGNVSDPATASVIILDTTPPSISTQNISVYLDANGEANITASQINNGSADNCGIDSFAINFSTFDCDDAGVNVLTLTAWDVNGNSSSAAANVTVLDTIPPSISTQNISVYLNAYGEANITASQINNGSADNCGIDSFAINFSAFDCSNTGINAVTLTAFDASGNVSDPATASVIILDTISPSISIQNINAYLDANGEVNIIASQINNGSADNCGIESFAINFNAFDCFHVNNAHLVTLTATDTSGNSSSAIANVTVLDTTPPSISIQNISVYLDANGEANITASQINNGSADNCGIDSFAISSDAFDCEDAGVNVLTLTAWDLSGNWSSATANVTILDTLSPIILANHDTIFLDSFGQAILTSSAIDAGTFDNCTLLYTDVSDSLFGCSDVNNAHLVWFIASDIFGNTDSTPKSIYVKDEIAPEIICLDTISISNDSGQCGAVVQFTEPTAFDNCSIDMMNKIDSTGLDSGMVFPVGITELSYAVFDQSGNSDTCNIVVEVIDNQPPILLCVPDTQICDSIFTFTLPNYFDNCSKLDIQHFEGPASGTFHPVGTTVHRFSILDPSGNSDTCSFKVLRYDYPSIAEAGDNQELCEETSIELAGNTPAVGNGYWTKISGNGTIADTNSSNTSIANLEFGITQVIWNIENGVCPVESDTISINNFSDSASINAGVDAIICDTSSMILNSVKPEIGLYHWNTPLNGASLSDTGTTNPTVTGLELGDYEFVWSVINGVCPPGTDTVTVSIKPNPVIVASDSSYIFDPSSVDVGASSETPVHYTWYNSSFSMIDSGSTINIRPEATETYIVQGMTEFGCVSFDSVYIRVNESLELPTAFTPDEDGFNDFWNIKELANYPKCEVRIFNRWGHTLFESIGYDTPWDGRFNGEQLPGGAYFFVIDLKVGELKPITGSITIIK